MVDEHPKSLQRHSGGGRNPVGPISGNVLSLRLLFLKRAVPIRHSREGGNPENPISRNMVVSLQTPCTTPPETCRSRPASDEVPPTPHSDSPNGIPQGRASHTNNLSPGTSRSPYAASHLPAIYKNPRGRFRFARPCHGAAPEAARCPEIEGTPPPLRSEPGPRP